MKLYAGIDGGQSATIAAIGDERGREIGRGHAGPADELGEARGSTRLRDALHEALTKALRAAGVPADTRLDAAVAGISGYDGTVRGVPPDLPASRVSLLHDAPVAYAGAFHAQPGIVAIVGTGSVVYGRNAKDATVTLGGWGYFFGDDGSAFWLAQRAIARAMRQSDAGARSAIESEILSHFNAGSLRDVARNYYAEEIDRRRIAAFAPVVTAAAQSGAEDLAQLVRTGTQRIARCLFAAAERLQMPQAEVAFVGGVTNSRIFRESITGSMREICPHLRCVEARGDAVSGALFLASHLG